MNRVYAIAGAIEKLATSVDSWVAAEVLGKLSPCIAAQVLDAMEIGVAAVVLALVDDQECQLIVSHCDRAWLLLAAEELNRDEAARLVRLAKC